MNAPMHAPAPVSNIPDARGINLFAADPYAAPMLRLYLPADLLAHLLPTFDELGGLAGGRLDELADVADKHPPTLSVRTRDGRDQSGIAKHPAYVELEKTAYAKLGLAAMSHRAGVLGWPAPMPPAAKYALSHLFVQAEFGLCCPVSMTDSLARTLRKYGDAELIRKVLPQVTAIDFDELRQGAMFMTEQAAGSDVSATETRAEQADDGSWRLTGDKWFCSNPDAGFAMVLARSEAKPGLGGVSLFLLPRDLPDGGHNHYRILRLKDKLGTRSMASGEIRLEGAFAWLVGERGRGFQQMADMINNSRLSNGMRAAGLMRRALTEATYFARHRRAFGSRLVDLPLMQRQLLKMLVPTEQARSIMFQTAAALERADRGDEAARALVRILTPLIKFRACRDARKVTGDAMEVRGGCGYIEEWAEARLLRDAHLGSIWEGTSNIVALDVLRAIERNRCLPALREHVERLLAEGRACPPDLAPLQDEALDKAFLLAEHAAHGKRPELARQAASALYNILTLAALRWEAAHEGLSTRGAIADLVLRHRLAPRDPCAQDGAAPELDALEALVF
ncbi:acyl-CoA dehydrogenase family protein [Parapusillimonas granuli]|uniref:Acyl-CoA dehydrogenase family protein n=1 Tax=Parapusillimonas granuli TaxID=380911 RepID=A0A853FWM2_9BURK|nr:acyl-CoA dehydrogenase family protein [Parapusillimonas granuli]MBB5214053.1 alkylation response protein AidB-like acyl-CoA dehydrogenase [Parapusillimonas granuli]MEB2400902.1 acyl-CoA dehydrogenase family protein [Alcaligenaceae bacterium]NYT50474.1 acyl-CoA dehydrogenase family protein [Parapusillimonas granuli]